MPTTRRFTLPGAVARHIATHHSHPGIHQALATATRTVRGRGHTLHLVVPLSTAHATLTILQSELASMNSGTLTPAAAGFPKRVLVSTVDQVSEALGVTDAPSYPEPHYPEMAR